MVEKCDGIRLIMAWRISKIHAKRVPRVGSSKKDRVPIPKAKKKDTLYQSWKLKKAPCPAAHPQYSQVWKCPHYPPPPGCKG